MARTIQEIYDSIITAKEAEAALSGLDSTSKVSIWRLWCFVFAVCAWALENIVGISMADMSAYIKAQKLYSFTWYASKAKLFQNGRALPWGETEYDNTGLTENEITALQVVKYATATPIPGAILVKVATLVGDDMAALPSPQFGAFKQYMFRVMAAGENLEFVNGMPDNIRFNVKIFFDGLILDSTGKRLDGTNDAPVSEAITNFLFGIDFNSRFIPADFVTYLQDVEGVRIAYPESIQTQYAAEPWTNVPPQGSEPNGGFFRVQTPTDITLTFEAWQE